MLTSELAGDTTTMNVASEEKIIAKPLDSKHTIIKSSGFNMENY